MMTCKLDKLLLQDLLDGTIDPLEKLLVDEHLKICPECRKDLNELKLLFWDLNDKSIYEIALPPELDQQLDQLKGLLLEQVFEPSPQSTFTALMGIQRKNIKSASKFLNYVPGVKTGNYLAKEGLKATPSALKLVSKGLLKSTKLLKAK
ncbi:zf-HC2 domain-containing protein [Desulfitobacterium chlororespirans]|uniref:Anti-sigma-W factor RsiW n=1 Tax=Desulfitobacterium chlororespirans DSM 11544 TaxID=1121395 RepID=A0A1M7UVI4_9FIRM|nr:zf-HC2 domain-containing protein [Desulfitobacterium chlororespirans]SHN86960.1 Putative zinc-finger [Desulfitobacterium chlororespirans DSM 11544]